MLGKFLSRQVDPEVAAAIDSLPLEVNDLGYDPWGFHPKSAQLYFTLAKKIFEYFHPKIYGIENLPEGRALFVGNHAGQFPFDALVISVSCLLHGKPPRLMRSMADRWVPTLPFVNIAFSRSGVVVGDPINCRNLLEADNSILVFPEGTNGSGKPFDKRYQLQNFGRGFMRLALQTNSPIVPVGVVGSEESIISLSDLKPLAKAIGAPYLPLPALLPLLGPLAYLPMPTQFHVHFGEPMTFEGPFDDEDEVIDSKVAEVKSSVHDLLQHGLKLRETWF